MCIRDRADAGGPLLARGAHGVEEIDEDALRGLGAQVDLRGGILVDALMGLEHEVELADAGEVLLAAHGAGDVVLGDVGSVSYTHLSQLEQYMYKPM